MVWLISKKINLSIVYSTNVLNCIFTGNKTVFSLSFPIRSTLCAIKSIQLFLEGCFVVLLKNIFRQIIVNSGCKKDWTMFDFGWTEHELWQPVLWYNCVFLLFWVYTLDFKQLEELSLVLVSYSKHSTFERFACNGKDCSLSMFFYAFMQKEYSLSTRAIIPENNAILDKLWKQPQYTFNETSPARTYFWL